MRKILFIISFPIVGLLLFCLGYAYHKPKTITVEKIKEVKVYDFSQEPKIMEIYANTMGKTLESKKDIDEYKRNSVREIEDYSHHLWRTGYNEGYKVGYSSR